MDVGDQAKADEFAFLRLSQGDKAAGSSHSKGDSSFHVHRTSGFFEWDGQIKAKSNNDHAQLKRCLLQLCDPKESFLRVGLELCQGLFANKPLAMKQGLRR
jgi:hypothetical protein